MSFNIIFLQNKGSPFCSFLVFLNSSSFFSYSVLQESMHVRPFLSGLTKELHVLWWFIMMGVWFNLCWHCLDSISSSSTPPSSSSSSFCSRLSIVFSTHYHYPRIYYKAKKNKIRAQFSVIVFKWSIRLIHLFEIIAAPDPQNLREKKR